MEQRDFFISYTKQDEDWAVWIADTLTRHGYTVYIQAWDSTPGHRIISWINEAMEHSRHFIAVWSEEYSKSGYCLSECEAGYKQSVEKRENGKRTCIFYPVRIEDSKLPPLYSQFGRVDVFDMDEPEAEAKLLNAVGYSGKIKRKGLFPGQRQSSTDVPNESAGNTGYTYYNYNTYTGDTSKTQAEKFRRLQNA